MSDRIKETLDSIRTIRGVLGAALLNNLGEIKGISLPDGINPKTVISIGKYIFKLTVRAKKDLNQGQFIKVTLKSTKGKILFASIEENLVMIITTKDSDILGLMSFVRI